VLLPGIAVETVFVMMEPLLQCVQVVGPAAYQDTQVVSALARLSEKLLLQKNSFFKVPYYVFGCFRRPFSGLFGAGLFRNTLLGRAINFTYPFWRRCYLLMKPRTPLIEVRNEYFTCGFEQV